MKNRMIILLVCFFASFLVGLNGFSQITFVQHDITTDFALATDAFPIDVDNDGDIDIIGASASTNGISWWENDGDQNFTTHLVSNNLGWARTCIGVDMDSDGDIDIVGAGYDPGAVIWWENDGEENFTEHMVDSTFAKAHTIAAEDVDKDGDMDILCSAFRTPGEIAWWENDGEENFTKHTIANISDQNPCVQAIDVDGDNDVDVVGCSYSQGKIYWWENDGNQSFTMHTVATNFAGAHWLYSIDVDRDGDIDIIGAAYNTSSFAWWENDGSQNFTKHIIDNSWKGSAWIHAKDLDNDNDIDIIGVPEESHTIVWWENDGEQNFTAYRVVPSFHEAYTGYPADIDNDGDLDIIGAASASKRISWFENDLYKFHFEGENTSGHAPLTVQFNDLSTSMHSILSWKWDFNNDGIIDSENQNPQWTFANPGNYTVRLDVSTDSSSQTMIYENYIHVFNGESALLFDGVNGYVSCPATPQLNITEKVTIEAWINPAGWGENPSLGFGRIIDKTKIALYLINESSVFNNHSLALQLLHADNSTSISMTPENSIALNEWQHVAITYDAPSSELIMYINGISQPLKFMKAPSGSIADNSMSDLFIGNINSNSFTFNGAIDEVRMWNTIRTAQEIETNKPAHFTKSQPGMIGCWGMNEGTGNLLTDISSNQNNGSIIDATWTQGIELIPTVIHNQDQITSPDEYRLFENYPNPFNSTTIIKFALPEIAHTSIKIFNIRGELVGTLSNNRIQAGAHFIEWNGVDDSGQSVSSGVYFCKMTANNYIHTQKMILIK